MAKSRALPFLGGGVVSLVLVTCSSVADVENPQDDPDPTPPTRTESFETVTRITPGTIRRGDYLGFSLDATSEFTVMSAPRDATLGSRVGAVYVLRRDGLNFDSNSFKILPDRATDEDQFGYAVAISGNTLVVGAPFSDVPVRTRALPTSTETRVPTSGRWRPSSPPTRPRPATSSDGASRSTAASSRLARRSMPRTIRTTVRSRTPTVWPRAACFSSKRLEAGADRQARAHEPTRASLGRVRAKRGYRRIADRGGRTRDGQHVLRRARVGLCIRTPRGCLRSDGSPRGLGRCR